MLNMRLCAGLALSVASLFVIAPGANATTYCATPDTGVSDCVYAASPQQALNMAAAHPGFDTVALGAGTYDVGAGLVYSDGGSADNGLLIESRTLCPDKYTCNTSTLSGGAAGTPVLKLSGAGGSDVNITVVRLKADEGATGVVLGPGTRLRGGNVWASDAPGISLEGIESAPALVQSTVATGMPAADVPGHGIVQNALLSGPLGVRVGAGGNVDIRGGSIRGSTGVTGPSARITGTAVTFGVWYSAPPMPELLGVEATCPSAAAPDAGIEITNATIFVGHGEGATGVRSAARGGDGQSCDASVSLSSSVVWGAEHSLDARGEPGSGADPRGGTARIGAAYSDFSAAAARQTAPAELDTSSPGGNLDADPRFVDGGMLGFYGLLWTSPLIDAGDPAPPEEWQRQFIEVAHDRRDIGEFEYRFARPVVRPTAFPATVTTGTDVLIDSAAADLDGSDELDVVWTLPDGSTARGFSLARRFHATGRYRFHVKATDPTGQVAEGYAVARVVRQRLSDLRVRPMRFRGHRRAKVLFTARAADTIGFRVARATHRRGRSRIRWKGLNRRFEAPAYEGSQNAVPIGGTLARGLRPGLYRLTARGRGDGATARTRFRVLR